MRLQFQLNSSRHVPASLVLQNMTFNVMVHGDNMQHEAWLVYNVLYVLMLSSDGGLHSNSL